VNPTQNPDLGDLKLGGGLAYNCWTEKKPSIITVETKPKPGNVNELPGVCANKHRNLALPLGAV
jgi:hypothetical protein